MKYEYFHHSNCDETRRLINCYINLYVDNKASTAKSLKQLRHAIRTTV